MQFRIVKIIVTISLQRACACRIP